MYLLESKQRYEICITGYCQKLALVWGIIQEYDGIYPKGPNPQIQAYG
jgi:hypothetical protein